VLRLASTNDGWPKFMKRFDEWRERNTGGGSSNGGGVGEVVGKFFADWKAGAPGGNGNGRRPSGASAGQMPGDIGALLTHRDPWPELLRAMGQAENQHRLFIGTDRSGNGGIWTTEARRNLLILGPPRSSKTVGVLVPAILAHPGPVVSTSTREDVYDATAIVRTRMGRLWHFNADGGELLPGCIPLRWSPIIPSKDWAAAISLGKAMADISDSGNGEYSAYFRTKAGVVIAALLHAAALGEKPMLWLLRAVNGERRILEEAEEILDSSFEPDTQIALSDLRGVLELDERTRSNVFSTTANAFAAYRLPGALASTEPGEDGYFDPAAFVAGQPDGYNPRRFAMLWPQDVREELEGFRFENQAVGVYDTVYLTASSSRQALVAPLVAALLSQLRDACFDRHRKDRAKGKRRPATLWALDEVAGIAPMKDLPEATLSQSGGLRAPGPLAGTGQVGRSRRRVPHAVRQHRGLPTAAGQRDPGGDLCTGRIHLDHRDFLGPVGRSGGRRTPERLERRRAPGAGACPRSGRDLRGPFRR